MWRAIAPAPVSVGRFLLCQQVICLRRETADRCLERQPYVSLSCVKTECVLAWGYLPGLEFAPNSGNVIDRRDLWKSERGRPEESFHTANSGVGTCWQSGAFVLHAGLLAHRWSTAYLNATTGKHRIL